MFSKDKGDLKRVPMMPVRDMVIFPEMMHPFIVGREASVRALEDALAGDKKIFLVTQHDASVDDPKPEEIYQVGTLANIVQSVKLPDGNIKVLVEGTTRAKIIQVTSDEGFFRASIRVVTDPVESTPQLQEASSRVTALFEQYVKLSQSLNYDTMIAAVRVEDASKLSDAIAANLQIPVEEKQELLELFDPLERLNRIADILEVETEKLNVDRSINTRVKRQMERAQKEYYLNEKLKAIQKELGRGEANEIEQLKKKIETSGMPEGPQEKAMQELKRLEMMPPMSAESTVSRNYLDWLLAVPWKKRSKEIRDIKRAETILSEDHYGLEKIKERILEYLAVRQLVKNPKSSILCSVGPPGVGKTSLAMSIGRATGRKFVRVSLGGVRDEAEIRGHRRTYIGAQPGRLVRALREAGTMNPVIVLDEVDKIGADYRGDPSSALLEVLDPAQNHTFRDHYLEVDLDLSRVLFIATANVIDTIPGPLLDRMEIIRIDGYTESEKVSIAKHHLVGRQLTRAALREDEVQITDEALRAVVADYTREAGVRNLERELGKMLRKVATKLASGEREAPIVVEADDVRGWLGRPHFFFEAADRTSVPGVVTGLAVTGAGGDVLFVEGSVSDGPEGLTLTGQLGDVMKESAEIALSYVRSHAEEHGIDPTIFAGKRFHVHVPAGAVPKDGPSAGVTMTTALVSLLRDVPVRSIVGMTGEVTLQGRVLPIGGVKQKVLAAHRAGLKEVVLPVRNGPDLEDVPEEVRNVMTFHLATTIADVLTPALSGEDAAEATGEPYLVVAA